MAQPVENKRYTYADYLTWDGNYELINGIAYPKEGVHGMAGTSLLHATARRELEVQFMNYLKGKNCKLFSETFDLRLNADSNDDIVVQPDIFIVCDLSKITMEGCVGSPDLIIEILSPSTSKRDRTIKLRLYEQAGVPEYWIVDPFNRYVTVYILEDEKYGLAANTYEANETIPVHVLKNCIIKLEDIFQDTYY